MGGGDFGLYDFFFWGGGGPVLAHTGYMETHTGSGTYFGSFISNLR